MPAEGVVSPTGTSAVDEKPAGQGVLVIRESKELWRRDARWIVGEWPPQITIDNSEVVQDFEDLPAADPFLDLGTLNDPRVQVIRAIRVEFNREQESVIASWKEAEEYGQGRDRSVALGDFTRTVVQLFVSLSRDEQALGEEMRTVLAILRRHMRFRIPG